MEKIANSLTLKATEQINNFCEPLRSLGIICFSHTITFGAGEVAMLTDSSEFYHYYYKYRTPMIFANDNGRLLNNGIYFDTTLAESSPFYKKMQATYVNDFSFKRIIYISSNEESCQHLFTFNFNLSEALFLHQCINRIDYLKNFIKYYMQTFRAIIEEAKMSKNRFILPSSPDKEQLSLPITMPLTKLAAHEQMTILSADSSNIITLTKQQSQCFKLLATGKKIKEIGKELNLSPRTVENYLTKIKQLTGYKNNIHLVSNYLAQVPSRGGI